MLQRNQSLKALIDLIGEHVAQAQALAAFDINSFGQCGPNLIAASLDQRDDVMLIRLHERIKSTNLVCDLTDDLVGMLLVANDKTNVLLKSCNLVQNVARMLRV